MNAPVIEGFEIVAPLTTTGQVWSYVARQENMDREVTLCILAPDAAQDPDAVKEFMARVKAAAQIELPAGLAIINVGSQPPYHYVVAEYAPGKTLEQMLDEQGPMEEDRALDLIVRIAQALNDAAGKNVVHGELRASDVIEDEAGAIRIARLGLCAAARNRTELQVYIQRDLYSLGNILKQLITGSQVLELSFADEPAASDLGPDDRSAEAVAARLHGTGSDAFSSYEEFFEWLGRDAAASAPSRPAQEEEPLFSLIDDSSDEPPTPDVAPPAPADEAAPGATPPPGLMLEEPGEEAKTETLYAHAVRAMENYQYKHAVRLLERLPPHYADVASRLAEARGKLKAWYDHIEAGKKLWEKGRATEAIEHWNAALLIRPNNRTLKQKIAQAKSLAGREVMVHDYLEEAKRLIRDGDLPAARLACQQALKIAPDSEEAKQQLADIDRIQAAADADAARQEGDMLFEQRRYGEAAAMWEKAIAMNPADVSLAAELRPLIKQAQSKRRMFLIFITLGGLLAAAAVAGAAALALSRR